MNLDEVNKCKQIAQSALAAGDSEKAIRLLNKALRMCPGDSSIEDLLKQAQRGPSTASAGSGSGGGPRPRPSGPESGAGRVRVNKEGKTYKAEDIQEVQRILRSKDYYDILGVKRNEGEAAIKKAYRKLALKLHPDKNAAPGAEEAFKKVSKAFQCLTDEEKRQVYDQYGDEEQIPAQRRAHYQQDFMTPEDLFTHIFGGGPVGGFHRHHRQAGGDGEGGAQRANILQMLPVVILILLTLTSNLVGREGGSRFSFTMSGQFTEERSTAALGVTFYVQSGFDDTYPEGTRSLAEFEKQVEVYHVRNLYSECDFQEKTMYKKVMIAKRKGNKDEVEKAKQHPKPACKELERVKKRHQSIYRAAVMVY